MTINIRYYDGDKEVRINVDTTTEYDKSNST